MPETKKVVKGQKQETSKLLEQFIVRESNFAIPMSHFVREQYSLVQCLSYAS